MLLSLWVSKLLVYGKCQLTNTAVTPIIRCPRGNAAEMVGRKLETKLRDHLASTSSQRGGGRDAYSSDALSSLQRPRKLACSYDWHWKLTWISIGHSRPEYRFDSHVITFLDISGSGA